MAGSSTLIQLCSGTEDSAATDHVPADLLTWNAHPFLCGIFCLELKVRGMGGAWGAWDGTALHRANGVHVQVHVHARTDSAPDSTIPHNPARSK